MVSKQNFHIHWLWMINCVVHGWSQVFMCAFDVCTYHSSLPNDAHPVLDSRHSMRDLGKVLFAQSSLLGAERTVLWCHHAQIVTETGNKISTFSLEERFYPRHLCRSLSCCCDQFTRSSTACWCECSTHTCPAGPWGSWVCLGRGGAEGRWHGRRHEPNPGGNTASHSTLREQL